MSASILQLVVNGQENGTPLPEPHVIDFIGGGTKVITTKEELKAYAEAVAYCSPFKKERTPWADGWC